MARIPAFLRGHKGGSKFKNTPDTIRSEDTVEVILGVGEGENFGLAEGAKSFLLGGTRLVNTNGEANFKDFQLTEYTGRANAPPVYPALGGFGSPTAANAGSLARNVPVVRTGTLTQIDFIDLRFLVQQLHTSNDKGIYAHELNLLIEYRPSYPAGQTWKRAWSYSNPIPPGYEENRGGDGVNQYTGGERPEDAYNSVHTFDGDNLLLRNEKLSEASAGPVGVFTNIWVDPSRGGATSGRPSVWNEDTQTWQPAPGVTETPEYWDYNGTRFYKNPANPPPSPEVGDVWTPPGGGPPVRYNGTSWVAALRSSAEIQRYQNAQYWAKWLGIDTSQPGMGNSNGVLSMRQKITSPVVREVRVPVEPIDVPYEIRVTKISADTTSDGKSVSEVGWESFEEIIAKAMSFPNTHIIHLIGRASDQVNSLPELMGDVRGRIVEVPTNYDPVTRTYHGVWDGLFKRAWSDNGAWCTRDFIKNNRYGLSALYPHEVNEASFYNWAQWCDQAIPNNKGGSRPRWTYNDTLDQPRSAKEQVDYMAGSCGARLIDDGSGIFDVLIDKDAPISMIFGPENVLEGEFTYSFSDIQTRANWIKVGFVNPELNWEVDWRVVQDPDHIAEFGRIPMEFVATGKTNVSEALAAARLRLATTTGEYTGVTFRTNRQGKFLVPFMNIGVSDPDMGWGISGRISEQTGPRQIRLRDPVYLETGVVYKFVFNRPTVPITTVSMALSPGQTGSLTTINFTTDLPADLPEFAQFSVESYNGADMRPIGLPKAFRILTITPSDENDVVEITALELNRSKWAYSDGTGALLPPEEYSNFNGELTRPQNVKVSTYTANVGNLVRRSLVVRWDQPVNPFGRNTWVEYSRDGGDFVKVGESDTEYYELEDAPNGIHAIRLTHVHVDGRQKSLPVTVVHEIGTYRNIPPPQNLRMVDQPGAPHFDTDDLTFEWDAGAEDANFSYYRVKVLRNMETDPSAPVMWVPLRVVEVTTSSWTYTLENITQDGYRDFRVQVHRVDDFGNESIPSNYIDADNPVPAAPVVSVVGTIGGVNITLSPPVERDVVGALVHVSTDTTPMERVLEGNQQQFFLELPDSDVRTIVAAYYDRHGKLDLEWSDPVQAAWVLLPPDAVEGVGEIIDRLETVESLTSEVAQSVADLEEAYGDTVAAAQSAAAAAASEAAAIQAASAAVIAQGGAQSAAQSAAQEAVEAAAKAGLAAQSATAAGGSATAAAGSASTAATKADDAGNSATAANASRVAAESARDIADQRATAAASSATAAATSASDAGQFASVADTAKQEAQTARAGAEAAQTIAVDSATTATGAASTATQQAGLAAVARDEAQTAASAAVTARNQASSFADDAGAAASAAMSAQVAAEAVLGQVGGTNLVSRESINIPAWAVNMSAPSLAGWGLRMVGNDGNQARTFTVGPLKTSTRYSLSFLARRTAGTGTTPVNMDLYLNTALVGTNRSLTDEWVRYTWEGFQSANADMTSSELRLRFFRNPMAVGLQYEITDIKLEEKATASEWSPSPRDAAFYARSSAESASVASASQTAAESAASAATTAKTAAETARGQAQTAATQASSSRDDAAGSAASASSSATNAANSRDAASGSASAAAGSASTAATKANEAGVSAAAASASQVSATTASKDALGAAIVGMPEIIRADLWATWNRPGKPEDRQSINANWVDADGAFIDYNSAGPKQYLKWETGRVIELVSTVHNPNAVSTQFRHNLGRFDAAYGYLNLQDLSPTTTIPAGQTLTVTSRFGMGVSVSGGTNVAQSGATWLSVAVRNNLTLGNPNRVLNLTVRDVTASVGAEGHANAAATSASSAAASETAAGQSATAASGSATNANTSAGNAQTYMNQASSSASAAAGSASAANTSAITAGTAASTANSAKDTAVSAAATATSQASSASASAAAASLSADLAASVNNQSGFNILPNSTFADGFTGWTPGGWQSNTTGAVGPHAYLTTSGTTAMWSDYISINSSLPYVLSGDFRRLASSGNVVIDLACYANTGGVLGYSGRAFVNSDTNFGEGSRRFVRITSFPSGTTRVRVRVFGENLSGLQTNGAGVRQIKLEVGSNMTAWRDDTQLLSLSAQLNITASTVADLDARMASARFEVTAAAGGNLAQIKIRADTSGSLAALVAQAISFANTVGDTVVEAMKLVGGEVFFMRPIYIDAGGRRLIVGPGSTWVLWFGPNTINATNATRTNGYFCLGTDGKVYYGSAELGGGGGDSALRSTIGGSAGVGTNGTSWVSAGSCSFGSLPTGGTLKIFASGTPQAGMTIEGSGIGTTVGGEARVVQNGTVIATGTLQATVAGGDSDVIINIPTSPINPVQTGATTLTLQVRSTTTNKNIGGTGMRTQIYAEWTKSG